MVRSGDVVDEEDKMLNKHVEEVAAEVAVREKKAYAEEGVDE